MNNFNYLNIYLDKFNLIEASAGTGKTNFLSLLYLRILFGINIEKKFLNLSLNNILVVTFTDLATLEVKNRILYNFDKLYLSLLNNYIIDDYIKDIYMYVKNIPNIINLFTYYKNNIDYISVFTIHSFCKKILFTYFINSDINYFSKLIDNSNDLYYDIVILFWRKYFYNLPLNLSKIIFSYWKNPKELYNYIFPILNFIDFKFNFYYNFNSIIDCYNNIIDYIICFKKIWLLNKNNILKYFNKKKYIYWLNVINNWCLENTVDFNFPYCILKFRYKYLLKKKICNNNVKIFFYIDNLINKIKILRSFIIIKCFNYIKNKIFIFKKNNNYISFDDLIKKVNFILFNSNSKLFINVIRNNFPIFLLDEFQDTDILQFNILNNIYIKNNLNNTKLILLGDPKQSIYTFRGANIFNYIKIKNNINFLYFLNINWRSSYYLVKSLNYLFCKINNPFIYNHNFYTPVNASYKNKLLLILKNNKKLSSMNFFVLNNINNLNYKKKIAKFCAIKIYNILNSNNYFLYNLDKVKRKILPSDISILVYKNSEVKIIFDVFKKFFLPINCILDKSNVFHTIEAKEVFFVLKSIINPNSKINLRNSLSTSIFNYDLITINNILNNDYLYINLINEFLNYYKILNKNGIYYLLSFLLKSKINYSNILTYENDQRNINILHIAEILNKKYYTIKNSFLLLNWLNKKIYSSNNINKEYYLRSFSYNSNGIKISTIHKSKGLQYNIVWIPFLITLNKSKYNIYHNRSNNRINIDLKKMYKFNNLMNEELFSEEMRLLYVAITRSIYQCNIVLYDIVNYKKKKFCFSPLGRLIGNNKEFDFLNIKKNINFFLNFKYIYYKFINLIDFLKINNFLIYKLKLNKTISNNFFSYKNLNIKYIFNYSNIVLKKKIKFNFLNKSYINNDKYNYWNLPKGLNIGSFFHKLLEKINFNDFFEYDLILNIMSNFNIEKKWFYIIKNFLFNILNVNLKPLNINLININKNNIIKEFEFFLYIVKKFNITKFNNIIKKYEKNCYLYNDLFNKNDFIGFLNGIIDLIFVYNNKYYIVDYKSNWLGNDYIFYKKKYIYKDILYNKYYIQYYIYSLALNNYLKLNLLNYNYNIHFGGIYYIYIRGLNINVDLNSYTGIFYIKPSINLINELNYFFLN